MPKRINRIQAGSTPRWHFAEQYTEGKQQVKY
jgi:hypothetical protein